MKVMLAVTSLSIGGAQTLILRLAEALAEGDEVYLYDFNMYAASQDLSVSHRLPTSVRLISARRFESAINFLISLDNKFRSVGFSTRWAELLRCFLFKKSVMKHKIDIVNTHLFHADYLVSASLTKLSVPMVMVDHGDYRFVLKDGIASQQMLSKIFQRVDAIVYISDSNLEILKGFLPARDVIKRKIYNGFSVASSQTDGLTERPQLNIGDGSVVFGMVARGIPDKGWEEAIYSFKEALKFAKKEIHLILVGGSQYLYDLQSRLSQQELSYIHFVGYDDNPERWIRACNVCLLPTYFSGESLPCSVVEYLAQGKPVVASNIGGIPEMLDYQGERAGVLIDLDETGKVDVSAFTTAMLIYVHSTDLIDKHSQLAYLAFDKFRLEHCIKEYKTLFSDVIQTQRSR
jgi:L-malate glycosyltransferase